MGFYMNVNSWLLKKQIKIKKNLSSQWYSLEIVQLALSNTHSLSLSDHLVTVKISDHLVTVKISDHLVTVKISDHLVTSQDIGPFGHSQDTLFLVDIFHLSNIGFVKSCIFKQYCLLLEQTCKRVLPCHIIFTSADHSCFN